MLSELVVTWFAPVAAAERCMVTDPTGSTLYVRRFDGKVIGARPGVYSRPTSLAASRHSTHLVSARSRVPESGGMAPEPSRASRERGQEEQRDVSVCNLPIVSAFGREHLSGPRRRGGDYDR